MIEGKGTVPISVSNSEKRRDITAEGRYLRAAEGLAYMLRYYLKNTDPNSSGLHLDITEGLLSTVLGSSDRAEQIEVLEEIEAVTARKAEHVELMYGRTTPIRELHYDAAAQADVA